MGSPFDEQTEFTLLLVDVGIKTSAIKAIREITGLGTAEAKHMIDHLPAKVLTGVPRDRAERGKALLDEAGAWSRIE